MNEKIATIGLMVFLTLGYFYAYESTHPNIFYVIFGVMHLALLVKLVRSVGNLAK
jgi:hypothetical protein